ncbi:hypothetical protein BC826DRAFT_1105697 [Russula brevipes]|nr:hypothetical protein BC826DRAFT_1105697 [Russula brevipes]
MSATLIGPVVLENPKAVEGSSHTVQFDGQMWLGPLHILTGSFRFFNNGTRSFDDVSHFYAIIHIAKGVAQHNVTAVGPSSTPPDVLASTDDSSHPPEDHVCGDIVDLLPIPAALAEHTPTGVFSGICTDSNKADGSFHITASQYTTFHRALNARACSVLTICAHFDAGRYKSKKPIPAQNTYVSIQGLLTHFDVDSVTLKPTVFHLSVENISFMGRAPRPSAPLSPPPGPYAPLRAGSRFRFNFGMPINASTSTASMSDSVTLPIANPNPDANPNMIPNAPDDRKKRTRVEL